MWFSIDAATTNAIAELERSSDRAIGIIAGAMIDSQLYAAISQFLQNEDENYSAKVRKDMFAFDGALGSFGARTNLAYLIGLISMNAHADLQTFGKIRNSFAHYTTHDTFETESIAARCKNFKLIDMHVSKAERSTLTVSGEHYIQDCIRISPNGVVTMELVETDAALGTSKGRFITTTKLFCAVLSNFADEKNWEKFPLI